MVYSRFAHFGSIRLPKSNVKGEEWCGIVKEGSRRGGRGKIIAGSGAGVRPGTRCGVSRQWAKQLFPRGGIGVIRGGVRGAGVSQEIGFDAAHERDDDGWESLWYFFARMPRGTAGLRYLMY